MGLIKSIEDVKKYLSIDISMNTRTIEPYYKPAEEQLIRLLGKELFDEIDEYCNYGETEDPELDLLLPYVQRPVVNFAFFLGLSMLNVSIGDNGIAVVSNSNLTPASRERTDTLKHDLEQAAYNAMESLLEFLEDNQEDYPLWKSSEAYSYQYDFLISSGRGFDELLRIDRSRLTFLNWRPTMADVEFRDIMPAVSKEFIQELKDQIKSGSVTGANRVVLPLLQKSLAYLTAAIEYNEGYETRGRQYLMQAKRILDAAPDKYPAYKTSNAYIANQKSYSKYDNTTGSNFFVTG